MINVTFCTLWICFHNIHIKKKVAKAYSSSVFKIPAQIQLKKYPNYPMQWRNGEAPCDRITIMSGSQYDVYMIRLIANLFMTSVDYDRAKSESFFFWMYIYSIGISGNWDLPQSPSFCELDEVENWPNKG